MSWYLGALKKYAVFSGRARRKEYWMFYLFNIIFLLLAMGLDNLLGITFSIGGTSMFYGYIYTIYALAVLIPGFALFVRRLHDLGKSGAWFFIGFIPFIGGIWLLVLMCIAGTVGPNKYGEDPKAVVQTVPEV